MVIRVKSLRVYMRKVFHETLMYNTHIGLSLSSHELVNERYSKLSIMHLYSFAYKIV